MSLFDRRAALAGAVIALAVAGCALAEQKKKPDAVHLEAVTVVTKAGEKKFMVEIADTEPERERGLMFRSSMADDRGMLFEFQDLRDRAFWMHNTYIPLDIIYIAPNGKIVSIAANAQPFDDTPLPSYGPAKGVLEINGGLAAKLGIAPGDTVRHPFFKN